MCICRNSRPFLLYQVAVKAFALLHVRLFVKCNFEPLLNQPCDRKDWLFDVANVKGYHYVLSCVVLHADPIVAVYFDWLVCDCSELWSCVLLCSGKSVANHVGQTCAALLSMVLVSAACVAPEHVVLPEATSGVVLVGAAGSGSFILGCTVSGPGCARCCRKCPVCCTTETRGLCCCSLQVADRNLAVLGEVSRLSTPLADVHCCFPFCSFAVSLSFVFSFSFSFVESCESFSSSVWVSLSYGTLLSLAAFVPCAADVHWCWSLSAAC